MPLSVSALRITDNIPALEFHQRWRFLSAAQPLICAFKAANDALPLRYLFWTRLRLSCVLYAVKLDSLGGFLRQRGFDQGDPVLHLILWRHCCLGLFQLLQLRLSTIVQDLYDIQKVLALFP
jgi:hypothetical protein